jgi:hypothetical protein
MWSARRVPQQLLLFQTLIIIIIIITIIIYYYGILGARRMRMGSGEGSTVRNFIVCTVRLM